VSNTVNIMNTNMHREAVRICSSQS